MSRLAKKRIAVPAGMKIDVGAGFVSLQSGDKKVGIEWLSDVALEVSDGSMSVSAAVSANAGLCWALLNNAVKGLVQPYQRDLEVVGVGYQCKVSGGKLTLNVGFANEVVLEIPDGVSVACSDPTKMQVRGADKQLVGNFCAAIRRVRPVEPYKGKGIRFAGEVVRRKEGKAFGAK